MRKNRGGYALLLMLLIVIVLGCIFSFSMNKGTLFQKEAEKDPSGQLLPWKEVNRIIAKDGQIKMPSPPQPAIAKMLGYKSYPQENSQERGELLFLIDPQGRVRGNWSGDFREGSDVSYSVMAGNFEGNVDPSKIYSDASGQDASRVYIIAKGRFLLLGDNKKTNSTFQRQGYIYVTGWLKSDYMLSGRMVLTSDKKEYTILNWEAHRSEKDSPLMF